MNILLISFDFRPNLGGVATCAFEVANALNATENNKVIVLAPFSNETTEHDKNCHLEIVRVNLPKVAIFSIIPLLFYLFKVTKEHKIDHIINMLWMPSGVASYLFSFFSKIKFSTFAHGVEVIESKATFRKRVRALLAPLKRRVFKKSHKALVVSDFTGKIINLPNVHPVYNGVNPQIFNPHANIDELKLKLEIPKDKIIFFTLTRMEDYKGVDKFLEALKIVKMSHQNFHYIVGGIGPFLDDLMKMVVELDLVEYVSFLRKVPSELLADYYALADMHVLISRYDSYTPNFEGFGLVFLEAGACGTPSIGGRSGGIPSAVKDGDTGILVNPEDPMEISSIVNKVLSKEIDIKRLGENALNWSRNEMTWDHVAQRILKGIN